MIATKRSMFLLTLACSHFSAVVSASPAAERLQAPTRSSLVSLAATSGALGYHSPGSGEASRTPAPFFGAALHVDWSKPDSNWGHGVRATVLGAVGLSVDWGDQHGYGGKEGLRDATLFAAEAGYLARYGGLWLSAGLALSATDLERTGTDNTRWTVAPLIAAGYDLSLSRHLAIRANAVATFPHLRFGGALVIKL